MKKLTLIFLFICASPVWGFGLAVVKEGESLLVVGASLEEAKTPCVLAADGSNPLDNPVACSSINFGDYMSLSAALQNHPWIQGQVISNGAGGAGTLPFDGYFPRLPDGSIPDDEHKTPVGFQQYSYPLQLIKGIYQVTNPFTDPVTVNARYVIIGTPNDCLHANAVTASPADSVPDQCSLANANGRTGLQELVDRMIAIGEQAIALGLTPVYTGYPPLADEGRSNGVNFDTVLNAIGFAWTISDDAYESLVADFNNRICESLGEQCIMARAWHRYENLGDGLHPTITTSKRAADRVVRAIRRFERANR